MIPKLSCPIHFKTLSIENTKDTMPDCHEISTLKTPSRKDVLENVQRIIKEYAFEANEVFEDYVKLEELHDKHDEAECDHCFTWDPFVGNAVCFKCKEMKPVGASSVQTKVYDVKIQDHFK